VTASSDVRKYGVRFTARVRCEDIMSFVFFLELRCSCTFANGSRDCEEELTRQEPTSGRRKRVERAADGNVRLLDVRFHCGRLFLIVFVALIVRETTRRDRGWIAKVCKVHPFDEKIKINLKYMVNYKS
jgi:hypothetical protein